MNATTRFGSQTPRFTGIRLLTDNLEAWQAKRDMIGGARRSLDLIYFIVDVDGTTSHLMLDLLAAAERGVRVRLLVDYYMTFGQAPALRTLAAAPNIEVRRYRPPADDWLAALRSAGVDEQLFVKGLMSTRPALIAEALKDNTLFPASLIADIKALQGGHSESRVEFALRVLALLRGMVTKGDERLGEKEVLQRARSALAQLEGKGGLATTIARGLIDFLRRTHHKLLLADGRWFIMGGRNLADAYQRGDPPASRAFADLDLLVCDEAGGAAEHVAAFDALWNNPLSVDIIRPDLLNQLPALELQTLEEKAREFDRAKPVADASLGRALPDMDGYIVNNLPSAHGDASITQAYIERIEALTAQGTPTVIDIVNAYLCLTDDAADSPTLYALRESLLTAARAGLTVNLRTNSLKTTDLKPVNEAAYANLVELIEAGVNVYELSEGQGSLHVKAAAIGTEWFIVGSYNFDPRSELFDTNNLIVLHDTSGVACAEFRKTRVDALAWTLLNVNEAKRLATEVQQKASKLGLVRRLL